MSFQFRRRGDVREQSPQQEPFFQNSSNQQNIIDSTMYAQPMSNHQGFDPRFNNEFGMHSPQGPQQFQTMQPRQQFHPQNQPQQQTFHGNGNGNGSNFPPQQQSGFGNIPRQNYPQQPILNSSAGQPYGMAHPQMTQQQPGIMTDQQKSYMHPVQASQLAGQKNYFQEYNNPSQNHSGAAPSQYTADYVREDARSLAFMQETHANSGFDQPENENDSNSPIKSLVAVAGIALVAGLSWFAYKWAKSPSSDTPPLIHAETGPHKISPDHRGGINIPYQDKLIYDRIGEGNSEEPAERLLPPPEKPSMMSNNHQSSHPANQEHSSEQQQPLYDDEPMEQKMTPAQQQSYPSTTQTPRQPRRQFQSEQAGNARVNNQAQSSERQTPNDTKKPETVEQIEPDVTLKTNTTPTIKGKFFVQLATVKTEAAALREWKRVQAKFNLKGMKSQIKESETSDGETVYRLLMGPFEEKVKALKYAVKIDGTKVVHITE